MSSLHYDSFEHSESHHDDGYDQQNHDQVTKRKRHRFHIPEEGVRLSITVPIFMLFGFYAFDEFEKGLNTWLFTWALWCAMTMVLASSNEMGGVVKDGLRRVGGVLLTGALATCVTYFFLTVDKKVSDRYDIHIEVVIVAIAGMLVMFIAQVFAQMTNYRKTAVIVSQLFIKCCFVGKQSGYLMIWSIVLGTCTGVLVISIASVLIFPRSNSYIAMINMKLAFEKLTEISQLTMDELIPNDKSTKNQEEVYVGLQETYEGVIQLTTQIKQEDNKLRQCEEMMFSLYKLLDAMKTNLKLSKNETCLFTRNTRNGPRWLLLPGAKFLRCCTNPLPYDDLEYVQVNIRRVARHLWSVLLSIDHMWDETVKEVIKQRYPAEVLPQIREQVTMVLNDIAVAFPGEGSVTHRHLAPLELAVEALLNVSNQWRTRAAIKGDNDTLAQQAKQRALKRASTRLNYAENRTPEKLYSIYTQQKALKAFGRFRSAVPKPVKTQEVKSKPTAAQITAQMETVSEDKELVFEKSQLPVSTAESVVPNDTAQSANQELEPITNNADENSGLMQALLEEQKPSKKDTGVVSRLRKMVTVQRKNIQLEVTAEQREKRREHLHGDNALSNPENIPSSEMSLGKIQSEESMGSPRSSHRYPLERNESASSASSLVVSVPLVEEDKALSFPETEEGYTQEARWYSFQFSLDELLDAMIDLHVAVNQLLRYSLPPLSLTPKIVDSYIVKYK